LLHPGALSWLRLDNRDYRHTLPADRVSAIRGPASDRANVSRGMVDRSPSTAVPAEGLCPDEQVILDLALGVLPPEARQRVWAHVERCQGCAALIGAALPFLGEDPPQPLLAPAPPEPDDTVPGPHAGEAPALSLQPGQLLRQRYRVVRYVGRGAMGEVYEARHVRLVGRYAIKILNVDLAHNPMARERFRREAGIASELRHPNIVQVTDFDETEAGRPYLVMELLEGRDLGALIAEGPIPLARALPLARQISAGLTAMHGQGIVHRDLKPANVFVLPETSGHEERVKLVDFGLSKRLVPSLAVTHDRMLLGTPQYMAPEQARGNSDGVGPAADQFAMAAIVYEMLAGRPAFDGDLLSVVLYRIVYEAPTPLGQLVPDLPPGIEAAIGRGLAKDPAARFSSVSALWEALAAGASARESTASSSTPAPESDHPRPARSARRARWLPVSAGVVAVGVGLPWAIMYLRRAPEPRLPASAPPVLAAPTATTEPALHPPEAKAPPPAPASTAAVAVPAHVPRRESARKPAPPPSAPEAVVAGDEPPAVGTLGAGSDASTAAAGRPDSGTEPESLGKRKEGGLVPHL
jgi:serine/threonine-protein kinase